MNRQHRCLPKEDGGPDVATKTATPAANHSTGLHPYQDGHAPPTADERYEAWILAEAQNLGYQLSCRCLDCRRPLTDKISVRSRRGRVCRERAGVTE